MFSLEPGAAPVEKFHGLLANTVGPRPIALASTVDREGKPNLSPFSCFNFFDVDPPLLIFSALRYSVNPRTWHTQENAETTREVVVNLVDHDMIQQTALAQADYGKEVNEFEKTGLTMQKADLVKPKRVAESPVHFECRVNDVMSPGESGDPVKLIVCEVLKLHLNENLVNTDLEIDHDQLDLVGQVGQTWYTRVKPEMFECPGPDPDNLGMGVDQLPEPIRDSTVLTGNDLGQLAGTGELPSKQTVDKFIADNDLDEFINESSIEKIHAIAQEYLRKDNLDGAWNILLAKTLKTI